MKLLLATQNEGKKKEIQDLLIDTNLEIVTLNDLGLADIDIEETGSTFAENALIKAKSIYDITGIPCLADDSGLVLEALPDIMGVYTGRFMAEFTQMEKNQKIIELLEGLPKEAYFICVLSYYDGSSHSFVGKINGTIADQVSVNQGFGEDPIFIPEGYSQTFADMSQQKKAMISHRGQALTQFKNYIKEVK